MHLQSKPYQKHGDYRGLATMEYNGVSGCHAHCTSWLLHVCCHCVMTCSLFSISFYEFCHTRVVQEALIMMRFTCPT